MDLKTLANAEAERAVWHQMKNPSCRRQSVHETDIVHIAEGKHSKIVKIDCGPASGLV